jgi:hypothetical protein
MRMHLVVDKVTGNIIGEHDSYVAAKTHVLSLTAAHPPVADELMILSNGREKSVPAAELRDAATQQDASAHALC